MSRTNTVRPVVLIATSQEHWLANVIEDDRYTIVQVRVGAQAAKWALDVRPDAILVDADLPDIAGTDVCRLLQSDPRVRPHVPILLLTGDKPTPSQRVAALRAGARDFLCYPGDAEELSLKLQAHVLAKRDMDAALAEGLADPTTGLLSAPALARRARELGALMGRDRGALSCIVFGVDTGPADPRVASVIAGTARISDAVGVLSSNEVAVIAPETDQTGAVILAQRVGSALHGLIASSSQSLASGPSVLAGYDAVANFTYSPIDPVDLLWRARAALHRGEPEPLYPWVRHYDDSAKAATQYWAATLGSARLGPDVEERRKKV